MGLLNIFALAIPPMRIKPFLVASLLLAWSNTSSAYVDWFSQYGLSVGQSRFFKDNIPGFHPGGNFNVHGGIEYKFVYARVGVGLMLLSDRRQVGDTRTAIEGVFEAPVGVGGIIRLKNVQIRIGSDLSFNTATLPLVEPEACLLFERPRRRINGFFIKAAFQSQQLPGNFNTYNYSYYGAGYMLQF